MGIVINQKMRKRSCSATKQGFTILELLLASIVIAIVLCVLLLEFITCSLLVESSRNLTQAVTHAQYVMEDIKQDATINFATIADKIKDVPSPAEWDFADETAVSNEGLTPLSNESIDTSVDDSVPSLLEITVTVNWQDRNNRNRTVSLETIIAEP